MNNPINMVDPDGRAAVPPDDHFDMDGNFLYTDNKITNNIVIHTDIFNFSTLNYETQLKDFTFNKYNYSTLSKIAEHYANSATVDLKKVHNGKISVGDAINVVNKGSYIEARLDGYNGGKYEPDDINGKKTLMYTSIEKSMIVINLFKGKVNPLLNDKYNFTSVLDHEGGLIGHLINPSKKHSEIYGDQISKYGKEITPEFLKSLLENFKNYKNDGN